MARLLNLVLLSVAAASGYALSTSGNARTGVSFSLDEATLGPIAQTAKAQHKGHAVESIRTAVMDKVVLEVSRGILHMLEGGEAATLGAQFFELAASDAGMKKAIGAVFAQAKGEFRHLQVREHAQIVADFAEGRTADHKLYARSRNKVLGFLKRFRGAVGPKATSAGTDPIPFEFLPQWRADVAVGSTSPVTIAGSRCYPSYSAVASTNNSHVSITLTANGEPANLLCSEQIVFIAGGIKFHFELYSAGTPTKTVSMDVADLNANSAAKWFLGDRGVRAYVITTDGILSTIGSVLDTLTMLSGFASLNPPQNVLDANLYFINNYIQGGGNVPRMGPLSVPRPANNTVVGSFDPSNIKSGDLLLLLRRDGIDPMIGWGEGSMAGHSVVAVRTGPGRADLQVCESTTLDGYWPDNGIQCHTWDKWVELCIAAGQNVVLVPLNATMSAKFDTQKALDFYNVNKGLDYGYSSFLFGWLDTATQNFPCTPSSNYTTCLDVQLAEQLAITLDSLFGSNHENFFRQSLAHRTGQWTTSPDTTPDVLSSIQYAQQQMNTPFEKLIQIIEQDSWLYQTTRDQGTDIVIGKSMVCCVFVCNMWKAGGLFDSLGSNFTCAEQTLWDLYSMKIYDENRMNANRPDVCKQADPTNPLCQLMGDITMVLVPDVNTRDFYPNMGEKCAAVPPQYIRPAGC